MKKTYWDRMYTFKYNIFYLNLYYEKCVKINRWVRIGTAVTSSAAIAVWARFSATAFICATLIALSQLVTAVYDVLPNRTRISTLYVLSAKWETLYIEIESHWREVNTGILTDEQINDLIYKYQKKWKELDTKTLGSDILDQNEKYKKIAEKKARHYFERYFGG